MVSRRSRRAIAAALVVLGLVQAATFFYRGDSTVSLITALGGIGYALAGVAFWFEI